ncbi:hypothetical protein ACPA9J_05470 [Pseudomonas aeruginosa]
MPSRWSGGASGSVEMVTVCGAGHPLAGAADQSPRAGTAPAAF